MSRDNRLFKLLKRLPKLGRFNAIPAGIIDTIYRDKPKNWIVQTFNFLQVRLVYLLLFVPLTLVDMAVSMFLAATYAFRTFFTSDETQQNRLELQQKYTTYFSKNLYALLASWIGLFNPKLVVLYFIPELENEIGVTAGGDYHHACHAQIQEPETVEELQEIMRQAAREGKKVMPMGAGRSQGKQFLPDEHDELIIINLSKLNSVEVHSADKEVIVGAGAIWSEVKEESNKFKLALKIMQASDVFSVGGSLGTNIHGWNIHDGMLSTVVTSITYIDAGGELKTVTPKDPLFHHITGGLGLYGIIVSATIKLTDNELLKEKGVAVTPEDYSAHFRNTIQKDPNTRMHLYRLSLDPQNLLGSGVAVSYVKEEKHPPVRDELHLESERGTRFERVMINLARHSPFIRKKYWESEQARLLANDSPAMSVNQIMQPPINAMFNAATSESEWLQEFFLPEENLAVFLKELGQLLMQNDVGLLNASVRFVKQNKQSPFSYAYDGDRFAVVLCFNQSLQEEEIIKAKKWIRQAQNLAIVQGGTYYLPYQHVSSPEDFERAYPHAQEAVKVKQSVDPENRFVSGFYQKYMAPKKVAPNYFKIMMSKPEYKAQFANFLKNVLYRLDSETFFELLEDVLQYNDSHEEIYQELIRRLPEIAPDAISDFRRTLDSLSSIKADLAKQAHSLLPQGTKTINGLVEIGYPGRFVGGFKEHYKITGEIVAVYEEQSITDYIQSGFPHPYDRFEQLDYSKPNLKNLADNSADVITCYVGLHHFEDGQLEIFLQDVRRVLRPGGHFLLVDHDVTDEQSMCMAQMAHSVFNVVNGISLEEEMAETRKFKSMDDWKQILAKHEFDYAVEGPDVPMIRTGDPSRNRMVSFAKPGPKLQLVSSQNSLEMESYPCWQKSTKKSRSSSLYGIFSLQSINQEERQELDSNNSLNHS